MGMDAVRFAKLNWDGIAPSKMQLAGLFVAME